MHTPTERERSLYENIWVIADTRGGRLRRVTFELLGEARRLADKRGSQVWCVILGDRVTDSAEQCFQRQADQVIVVDDPLLKDFVDDVHSRVLARLIRAYRPETVLCGATAAGRALAPRIAVDLGTGLTADCTGLDIDPETGELLQTRPAFGGNIMATIKCADHRPQMATVRPRVMKEAEPDPGRSGVPIVEPLRPEERTSSARVVGSSLNAAQTTSIADARFIVAGGRGVRGKEGFDLLRQFAALVGGAVGASRAAVDAGWIDYAHQVGQTGQTVQPRVYLACGVSGQIQHLVGMQTAGIIIAINKDPDAPIMKIADYAIVGDYEELLPAMMKELTGT